MTAMRTLSILLALVIVAGAGCARAARDTTGFTHRESITVNADFMETWETTRSLLRELNFDIYTRDKRGIFVAFTDESRYWLVPNRTQHTIILEELSPASTRVTVETVNQVYGVTLLTYPDWHDRPARDPEEAVSLLQALQERFDGPAPEPEAEDEMARLGGAI